VRDLRGDRHPSQVRLKRLVGAAAGIYVDRMRRRGLLVLLLATLGATAAPALAAPPPNDNIANATAITGPGPTFSFSGTTVEATIETDEPRNTGSAGADGSVWYSWTPPTSGPVLISTCDGTAAGPTAFDTTTGVYVRIAGKLELITTNDDGPRPDCVSFESRTALDAVAGTEYLISIDGFGSTAGAFAATITPGVNTIASAGPSPARRTWIESRAEGGIERATFTCAFDGGEPAPCAAIQLLEGFSTGLHTVDVLASVGGVSDPTGATVKFNIDLVPPSGTDIFSTPTTDPSQDFAFGSSDGGNQGRCTLDGAPDSCQSPYTTPALCNEAHEFTVAALEPSGATDPIPARVTYTTAGGAPCADPVVTTTTVAGSTQDFARMRGTVNSGGRAVATFFEYGETTDYGLRTTAQLLVTAAPTGFEVGVASPPATTWHYRAVAVDKEGDRFTGTDQTVTTLAPVLGNSEFVQTEPTDITGTSAVIHSTVTHGMNGGPFRVSASVERVDAPATSAVFNPPVRVPVAPGTYDVAIPIADLVEGATYQVQITGNGQQGFGFSKARVLVPKSPPPAPAPSPSPTPAPTPSPTPIVAPALRTPLGSLTLGTVKIKPFLAGKVSASARCTRRCSISLRLTVKQTLRKGGKKRTVTTLLATAKGSRTTAGTLKLKLAPTKAARGVLKGRRRLATTLAITASDPVARRSFASKRSVTIRR